MLSPSYLLIYDGVMRLFIRFLISALSLGVSITGACLLADDIKPRGVSSKLLWYSSLLFLKPDVPLTALA